MSEEEDARSTAEEQKQQEELDTHETGKQVAKIGAKAAASYFAPGVGGAAVDAIASTEVGDKVLDAASDVLNSSPVMHKVLKDAKPAVDQAGPALDALAGGVGGAPGAAAGQAGASAAGSGVNAAQAGATAGASSAPTDAAKMPAGQQHPTNSTSVKTKSASPDIRRTQQNPKGYDQPQEEASMPEADASEADSAPEEKKSEPEVPEEPAYDDDVPTPEEPEEKKKKGGILKALKTAVFIINWGPLIIVSIPVLIFIIAILYLFSGADDHNQFGAGGFAYYNTPCTQVTVFGSEHEGQNGYSVNGTYDLDTYIAGVVIAEVGSFHNEEVFKAFAVAARTYAIRHFESSGTCEIAGNTTKQSFLSKDLAVSLGHNFDVVMDAVRATMGVVLTNGQGKLISTEYDAFCMDHTDANYYYLRQQNQALSRTWVEEHVPSAYRSGVCAGGHGRGMSQYGALYLATQQAKSYQDILQYYYKDAVFHSIILSSASNNYLLATSAGTQDQIKMPLSDFLASKNSSVSALNEYIMNAVKEAGPGTRDGVVAAASGLVGGLYEMYHAKLPYTLSGGHGGGIYNTSGTNINRVYTNFYGVDPMWGSPIRSASGGTFTYYYRGQTLPFTHYGPDCSGFVAWAIHNGGFQTVVTTTTGSFGPNYKMDGSYIGQPGDLIYHPGHIMMIIGVDTEAQKYYVAEANGRINGTYISVRNFVWANNYIVDMTEYYATHVKTQDPTEYESIFRAGMLS